MKLYELMPLGTGTYVAVYPTDPTLRLLQDWADDNHVQLNDDLHVTILYSRKVVNVQALLDEHICTPTKFNELGGMFVIELNAPSIAARHDQLIAQGGTHDFPRFLPHVSLCKGTPAHEIRPIDFGMSFGFEHSEPLNL